MAEREKEKKRDKKILSAEVLVVYLPSLPFPFAYRYHRLPTYPLRPILRLVLCVANRCPPTYHAEHYWCFILQCQLADAGARCCRDPGFLDDRRLCASIHTSALVLSLLTLYFPSTGGHHPFIQRPSSKQ